MHVRTSREYRYDSPTKRRRDLNLTKNIKYLSITYMFDAKVLWPTAMKLN